jgi:VWFA-related protein
MKRSCLAVCVAVLGLASILSTSAQDRQNPPQATFRSSVELVRLDVRVVDGQGRPVTDLRPEDLEVVDKGEVRPIVLFQRVAEPAGSYLEIGRRTIGAEVSTNRGAPRGHIYLLVFDQQHITAGNEQRARMAAAQFLKTRVKPGDRVALYAIPGPGPQVPLTADTHAISSRLFEVRGTLERDMLSSLGSMSMFEAYEAVRGNSAIIQRILTRLEGTDATLDTVRKLASQTAASSGASASELQAQIRDSARTLVTRSDAETRMVLSQLSDVIRTIAGIEGRKAIIFVSEGFFSDFVQNELEQVASAAAQASAVIYALDINRRGIDINQAEAVGTDDITETQFRLEPLGGLASDTSGELFTDAGGHLEVVFNRIAEQSMDYYIVGFEPAAGATADDPRRYHRIEIRSKRPGTTVRSRTGYAVRDPALIRDRRRAIDMALSAPFPQQEVPIDLTTYVARGHALGAHRVVVSAQVELPVSGVASRRPADVVFVVKRAADGAIVASGTDLLALPDTPTSGAIGVGTYNVQFEAPAGHYMMRLVVRDPASGVTGSADRRFEVPDFDGTDLSASDLIIGGRPGTLPVRAKVYGTDTLVGSMEVYARRPGDLDDVVATAELAPVGGRPVLTARSEIKPSSGDAGRTIGIELPLGGIPPGDYVVKVIVRARGETAAERLREVQVAAGSPPPAAPPRPADPVLVLGGDVVQRLVMRIQAGAADPAMRSAAEHATAQDWSALASALPPAAVTPQGHALAGLAAFASRNYGRAVTEFESAMAGDPASAETAFVLGWARSANHDDTGAVTAWRQATLLDTALVPGYLALANAYQRLGQPALAAQALRAGLAARPDSFELQNKLAELERR